MNDDNNTAKQKQSVVEKADAKEKKQTDQPENFPVESVRRYIPFSESWVNRHSKAIMAWAAIGGFLTTFILALIAYFSWEEIKLQRELAFKQFVIANAPSVRVYATKGFTFDNDIAWLEWDTANKGGYVKDLEFKALVLCCGLSEISNQNLTKIIDRTHISERLNKDEIKTVRHTIYSKEEIDLLKKSIEKEKQVILYIQTKYTIPPELSFSGKPTQDKAYAVLLWVAHTKSFENLPAEYARNVIALIRDRGYLK